MTFDIQVSANISSKYRGNIYTLAFSHPYNESNILEIQQFILANRFTSSDILELIPTINGVILCQTSGTITKFSITLIAHKPMTSFSYSDNSVFLCAINELDLKSTVFSGRHNAFSFDFTEEQLLSNALVIYSNVIDHNFSINKITSNVEIQNAEDASNYYILASINDIENHEQLFLLH